MEGPFKFQGYLNLIEFLNPRRVHIFNEKLEKILAE
jgi:hypothetical protein